MNDVTIIRTADVIAAEINSIKAQTRMFALCSSIEIGRRLIEAKDMLEHGQWGSWLKESVDYSQSTAENLMRIFKEYGAEQLPLFGDNAKSQALGNLGYTQAVALLGLPADQREAFAETNDVANMSTRELQEAIRKQKEAEVKVAAAEKRATTAEAKATTAEIARANAEKALKDAQDKAKKEISRLTTQLEEAKQAGASDEKLAEMTGELHEAQEKVRQLTEQLAQPVTVEATVKPDPAAVAVMKFGIQFDALVVNFRNLLAAWGEIKDADPDAGEKYKGVVAGLIGKMAEKL